MLRLFDVYEIFFSSQVKGCGIIAYKHDIYELPHELLNDLRLRIPGNWEISENYLNDSLVPSSLVKMKVLLILE